MIDVLSLGAGVQSSAVLLMSCRGELPKLDCAIFADVGWEPQAVYENLYDFLIPEAEKHGIPVHIVNRGNLKHDALLTKVRGRSLRDDNGKLIARWASMPYFTLDKDGNIGMIKRQCTTEYKIHPVNRFIKTELLGLADRARWPKDLVLRQWFGISLDEARRARITEDKWRENYYPLIMKKMTRTHCRAWLKEYYPRINVPRSACIGCPFHDGDEWRHIRDHYPDEWQDAIEFDKKIRKCGGLRGETFLHRSCVPLDEVDFRTAEDMGQQTLSFSDECAGVCGV